MVRLFSAISLSPPTCQDRTAAPVLPSQLLGVDSGFIFASVSLLNVAYSSGDFTHLPPQVP